MQKNVTRILFQHTVKNCLKKISDNKIFLQATPASYLVTFFLYNIYQANTSSTSCKRDTYIPKLL